MFRQGLLSHHDGARCGAAGAGEMCRASVLSFLIQMLEIQETIFLQKELSNPKVFILGRKRNNEFTVDSEQR